MTDRFGHRAAIAGAPKCTDLSNYCGGTWVAIRDKIKYIQVSGSGIGSLGGSLPGGRRHLICHSRCPSRSADLGRSADTPGLAFGGAAGQQLLLQKRRASDASSPLHWIESAAQVPQKPAAAPPRPPEAAQGRRCRPAVLPPGG